MMNQYAGPNFPQNMQTGLQCTFGQSWKTAIDGNDTDILGHTPCSDIRVISRTLINEFDFENFCELFEIKENILLETFANSKTYIDAIWNFFFDKIKGPCFCINIYNSNCFYERKVDSISAADEHRITKFYFGQNYLIIIPVDKEIPQFNKCIKNIIMKKANEPPIFLQSAGEILINFTVRETCSNVFEYLETLKEHSDEKSEICLLMEIQKYKQPSTIFKNELLTILATKKFLHTVEDIFYSEAVCENDDNLSPVEMTDIEAINEQLKYQLTEMTDTLATGHPPRFLKILYSDLKFYLDAYLKLVDQNDGKMPETKNLPILLMDASKELMATHFAKEDECWILKENENNASEIYSIVNEKCRIILNEKTKNHLKQIYDDTNGYYYIISSRKNHKKFGQPVIVFPDKTLHQFGLVFGTLNAANETFTLTNQFISSCDCQAENKEKIIWLCEKCKKLLFVTKENPQWIKCKCEGVYVRSKLSKKCFCCKDKSDIAVVPKSPLIPKASNESQKSIKNKTKSVNPKTILFIGQTGAGKSTLINSMANYVEYDFEEACKNEIKCFLPCQFQLQTPDLKNVIIKDGPENENEDHNNDGESVTQKPKIYFIKTSKYTFNIIDTPGLGDSRGAEQDSINVKYIRKAVHECGKIDGICFVVQSNITKLTANFEILMRDLLSIFPKTALKNIFFFFTYANSTCFAIGETRNPIDAFISKFRKSNNAEIPFGPDNVYCVDSEAFMYFLASKQKHVYQHRTEESFALSWTKSKNAINKFLTALEKIEPIQSCDIREAYDLEQIVMDLKRETDFSGNAQALTDFLSKTVEHNSMTIFASSFQSSKFLAKGEIKEALERKNVFSKKETKEALELILEFVKSVPIKNKITDFLKNYYNIEKEWHHQKWVSAVKKDVQDVAEVLANLYEEKRLNKNLYDSLFIIYHANAIKEKVPTELQDALNLFLEYSKKSSNQRLKESIIKVLKEIAKNPETPALIVEKM